MSYKGSLKINNETFDIMDNKNKYYAILKFSISFNNKILYLDKTFLSQVLDSNAVKKYLYEEVKMYLCDNSNLLNKYAENIISINKTSLIEVKFIGKYFFIYIPYVQNFNTDNYLAALNNRLKHKENIDFLLKNK